MKTRRLRKDLGLFDVFAVCTGAMFSSGFFLLPGIAAADAGPSVVIAYVLAGILVLPAMLSVAELSTAMPKAGGAYYFIDRALGPAFGTIGGLGSWFALVLKSAFALLGVGAYLALVVDLPIRAVALVMVMLFAIVNVVGAKETAGLQRILVVVLLAALGLWMAGGLWTWSGSLAVHDDPRGFLAGGLEGVVATTGLVFVSYAGLTKVASIAEEVRNPDRNIPLGMVLSLVVATFVYAVGVALVVAMVPSAQLHDDLAPIATAGEISLGFLPGAIGVGIVVAAALAAFASTANAGLLSSSRYPLAMARDQLLPRWAGRIGRFGTPSLSVLVTAAVMGVIVVAIDVVALAKAASAVQLALFALLNLAVIVLRESGLSFYRPGFRSPLYPWVQIAGIAIPFVLLVMMGPIAAVSIGVVVALSLGWYFAYGRSRVERVGALFHVFARLGRRASQGLDREFRGIVQEKSKGTRDPFLRLVNEARVIDLIGAADFESALAMAAFNLSPPVPGVEAKWTQQLFDESRLGLVPVVDAVALPHIEAPEATEHQLVVLRSRPGLLVTTPGGFARVHAVLLLVSPHASPGLHLRLLADLAAAAEDPEFLVGWLDAETEHALQQTLLAGELGERAA